MSTILDDIVASTQDRLAASKNHISILDLQSLPLFARTPTSLCAALQKDEMNIIAEVKRASPSAGSIDQLASVATISIAYEKAGAAAVSVLTEPHFFGGSLKDLTEVRQRIDLPVLRKDFIIDAYQIVEAKAHGADAVLLIARILSANQLHDLHQVADELGLDVLVELYDKNEVDRLDLDQVKIVGANNRDLSTMTVDIHRSVEILSELPAHIARVSESGIDCRAQIETLINSDIHAALIGESLMRSADSGAFLNQLLSRA